MDRIRKIGCFGLLLSVILLGCVSSADQTEENAAQASPVIGTFAPPDEPLGVITPVNQYTSQNKLTGNHIVDGSVDLQASSILDIPVDGTPIWLVSGVSGNDLIFVAIMDNGMTQAFKIMGKSYESIPITPVSLPPGMPPLLAVHDREPQLIIPPADASPLTSPILLDDKLAYIASNGDIVVDKVRLPVNALLDSRILVDEKNRILILTQPTDRYDHGVIGDDQEASAVIILEPEPELSIKSTIPIHAPDVIEGISPIWEDIDNDGSREIIVTLSNAQNGARIVAFREDGNLLVESDPIGQGNRWRHQIAFAKFDADKSSLLVSVRTPHIGGIVEFFQINKGKLEIVREITGFSTHTIGSRNLDMAIAGDFNNDGVIELLVPDQPHTSLGIISLDGINATLPLTGQLTSNLSAVALDGKIHVGVGTNGNLRLWIP